VRTLAAFDRIQWFETAYLAMLTNLMGRFPPGWCDSDILLEEIS
jgi:hypothetical protein